MKLSTWTATVLATPAVATGVCLLCASTAQAAPDDAGSETSSAAASSAADTSASSSTDSDGASTKPRANDTTDGGGSGNDSDDAGDSGDLDNDDEDADGDTRGDSDDADLNAEMDADIADAALDDSAVDDSAADPGPHYVPTTVRETLVTGDAVDVDGDGVDDGPVDEDDEDTPADDEPADDDPVDTVPIALEQISDAKEDLREATWDSGNVLAGLAAMLPQMYLSGASASLERWQQNHALLQQRYAETYDDPFAHWLAGARIENSIQRTIRVQDQLEAAEKLLTVVGWFGTASQMEAIGQLIGTAADNGLVYQIVKMELQYNGDNPVRTEPVIYISVNGGKPAPVLVDTGSLGLIIDPRDVGVDGIGEPTGTGTASYGDGSSVFFWDSYDIPISVDGVESSPTQILVVELQSAQGFTDYNGDYVGVLGIGANAGGPGNFNPFLSMPGLLSQGVLFDERRRRLILGPNPYGARTTIPGAPSSQLQVKIGDGEKTLVDTWVDSGGILGSVPDNVYGDGPEVPPGTVVSVYTEDGETLLYSYTTTRKNTLSVTDSEDDPRFNTGFTPFSLGTLYFSFAGAGSTSFNY
ncbi:MULTISPECIES: PecA family PE domain-processing aspartic protease [Mycobacteriaceae]|uniref:PecA family PE domain-processing aspartic protease n=1 Tax=Mycolicibacterium parafortuitum TaxID=39692 RepID=A0ACC6MJH7_MYCPF|nr:MULTISPECIES: PecA family PE domain-processing aspartic protease [Mycobacteriaceae]MDZ5087085.1 PecA family PE domain-processing aspartic protease [Mycolicibacterium parafortuitum]GFM19171.1 PE-PGRS family protein [Mycobacterium sp. PO1]GFM24645.1 PE-PGRS family protein [Mycobacterium sp. PO2]